MQKKIDNFNIKIKLRNIIDNTNNKIKIGKNLIITQLLSYSIVKKYTYITCINYHLKYLYI
jgi:hypothetical protein